MKRIAQTNLKYDCSFQFKNDVKTSSDFDSLDHSFQINENKFETQPDEI